MLLGLLHTTVGMNQNNCLEMNLKYMYVDTNKGFGPSDLNAFQFISLLLIFRETPFKSNTTFQIMSLIETKENKSLAVIYFTVLLQVLQFSL